MEFTIYLNDQAVQEDPDLKKYAEALKLLANRMSVSHFKYGNMRDKYPTSAQAIDSMGPRLDAYMETGNTENLLDAANFAIIEHLFPSHGQAHFRSQESHESPGLVWKE